MRQLDVSKLKALVTAIFEKVGVCPEQAQIIAQTLLEAEQRGVHSHGVVCVTRYVDLIQKGFMKANMEHEVLRSAPAVEVWDGKRSNGQVLGYYAMKRAMEKAKSCGVGMVGVKSTNHFGAGAYYAQMAQKEGMIGIALSTGSPTMAPWGGAEKAIGNNPLAIAVPTREEIPPVLDMAQSVVANGKITNMMKQGIKEIPEGWALDKEGMPTTKMEDFYSVTPLGAYKGFGMSFMVDVLSGLLIGGGVGFEAGDFKDGPGIMMMALDVAAFRDPQMFLTDVDHRIQELKSVRKAKNSSGIMMPGEPEARSFAESAQKVSVLPEIMDSLNDLARQLGREPVE